MTATYILGALIALAYCAEQIEERRLCGDDATWRDYAKMCVISVAWPACVAWAMYSYARERVARQ